MYNPDCLLIADWASQKPANLFRVGLFVLGTINQHLEHVPLFMEAFAKDDLKTSWLSKQRRYAVATLRHEQERFFNVIQHGTTALAILRDIVELPGFGIVKGAFFAQLLGFEVACLDRHNLRLAGLDEKAFKRVPTSTEGLTRKLGTYSDLCQRLGGSEALWNQWCAHVSQVRPKVFPSAEHVSQLHVQCIVR